MQEKVRKQTNAAIKQIRAEGFLELVGQDLVPNTAKGLFDNEEAFAVGICYVYYRPHQLLGSTTVNAETELLTSRAR